MNTPQFIDISSFQGNIDFNAYRQWSESFDGVSRIAMKTTEGIGFTDPSFASNRAKALAAGIDCILYYHFSRPDLSNTSVAEADYAHSVVGGIRTTDYIVLDYEVNTPLATADWAYGWLARQEQNYGGKLPAIYASSSYISTHLQDSRLPRYPLWLANWTFDPTARPASPAPWASYTWLQFSDAMTGIPGLSGKVDCNIDLGGSSMNTVPTGWKDNGSVLTAPNSVVVTGDYRNYVLSHSWDANNYPLQAMQARTTLELSNTGLGAGTWQPFRWTVLEQPQSKQVIMMWAGQELLTTRSRMDQISALTK